MQTLNSSTLARMGPGVVSFCRIRLNEEHWNTYIEAEKALEVPGWKAPQSFIFQFDGEAYELRPGQDMVVPKIVAEHGVTQSHRYPTAVDPESKRITYYRYSGTFPMVEIVEHIDPTSNDNPIKPVKEASPVDCPFCGDSVAPEDFKKHMFGKHAGDFAAIERKQEKEKTRARRSSGDMVAVPVGDLEE